MREVKVAALQMAMGVDGSENIEMISTLIESAAQQGAQIILPPELFETPYFCKVEDEALFALARPLEDAASVQAMRRLAKSLKIAIPTSFFEKEGHHYYNSLAMIDPDGDIIGVYRKCHIPDGPGYEEKYYFRPGNNGFRVWDVMGVHIGVGICWDQWFPESARIMALMGAEMLFYPTAIGTEPYDQTLNTGGMWQRAMQGHAVCNFTPIIAANRTGDEGGQFFYGHSFICDETGKKLHELGPNEHGFISTSFDLDIIAERRAGMGFFRDRRPELYNEMTRR